MYLIYELQPIEDSRLKCVVYIYYSILRKVSNGTIEPVSKKTDDTPTGCLM